MQCGTTMASQLAQFSQPMCLQSSSNEWLAILTSSAKIEPRHVRVLRTEQCMNQRAAMRLEIYMVALIPVGVQ